MHLIGFYMTLTKIESLKPVGYDLHKNLSTLDPNTELHKCKQMMKAIIPGVQSRHLGS